VYYLLQNRTEDTLPTPPHTAATASNKGNSSSNNKHKQTYKQKCN